MQEIRKCEKGLNSGCRLNTEEYGGAADCKETALAEVKALTASYGEEDVLKDISFCIGRGEAVCIAGESGSGKSTLIKAMHGIDGPDIISGSILYRGEEITHLRGEPRRRILGSGIALIPQDPAASFNPLRSFRSQFREALRSHGIEYDEERITDIMSRMGLRDVSSVRGSRPYELSGGMNQRIAIAAALMMEPDLLLCDEATSALDVTTAAAVVSELMRIKEQMGTSILMVTHHLGIAARIGGTLGIMKDGRLVEYGPASKVLSDPDDEYTRTLIRDVPRLRDR